MNKRNVNFKHYISVYKKAREKDTNIETKICQGTVHNLQFIRSLKRNKIFVLEILIY